MNRKRLISFALAIFMISQSFVYGQKPYRMGTTAASFLEIGIGSAAIAMGDAYVASASDLSSLYWNPAGLALMDRNEVMFMYQPWVADINSYFAGFGLVVPNIGALAFGIAGLNYGDMDVTTMEYQRGTGEKYTANDINFSMSYARRLVNWFAFGATAKYITSQIWHCTASAFAMDLGVKVQTNFFSATGRQDDGLIIGMSISNYGTRMKYDGYDLLFPVDIDETAQGNYQNAQGKHNVGSWELPLLFRVGIAVDPIVFSNHRVTLGIDALHPNNMSESVNLGAQYRLSVPGVGNFSLRGGYKGLFADDNQFGTTFGAGFKLWMSKSRSVNVDYAFHSIGPLGNIHTSSIGIAF